MRMISLQDAGVGFSSRSPDCHMRSHPLLGCTQATSLSALPTPMQWPAVAAELGGKRTAIASLRRWLELERRASSAPRSQEGAAGPVPSGMEAGTAGPSAGPARQGGELSPDQLSLLARLMQRHGPRWKVIECDLIGLTTHMRRDSRLQTRPTPSARHGTHAW